MTKNNLTEGMKIILRNGEKGQFRGTSQNHVFQRFIMRNQIIFLNDYDDDLKHKEDSQLDVIRMGESSVEGKD